MDNANLTTCSDICEPNNRRRSFAHACGVQPRWFKSLIEEPPRMNAGVSLFVRWLIWHLLLSLMTCLWLGGVAAAAPVSLEKMVGQMILIGFKGQSAGDRTVKRVAGDIAAGRIGGVLLFGRNIASPAQLKTLTGYLMQEASGLPPIIAVDQEGGQIQRLTAVKGFEREPSAFYVANNKSTKEAYDIYYGMASQLRLHGINMNLGPVVDLNINPRNPVIGRLNRSFGDDERVVFDYAEAFVKAHRDAGVLTCLKHWPGHGSATGDSHKKGTPVDDINRTLEEQVYVNLVEASLADVVMASHIILDDDAARLPASLSSRSITDRLRASVGFQGVVISDDMQMGAIANSFGLEDAVVRAVNAGIDMLIFANMLAYDPDVGDKVRAIIIDGVTSDRINRDRIREAFERISALKVLLHPQ